VRALGFGAVLSSVSWGESLSASPKRSAVAGVGLIIAVVVAVVALRLLDRRARSLRTQVLVVTLGALGLGAVAAATMSWLMVLDPGEVRTAMAVLAVTAVIAVFLVVVATQPLGNDIDRLEATVRRIEHGDRDVRTGIHRADELGHVARALDELTARLDTLERERVRLEDERSAMLTHVSHDLRTPLAALQVAVEALIDGVAPDPDRYYRSMRRDVDALSSLVDDLFLLVRLENGRFELHPVTVDLTEIADEALEALAPVGHARRVDLVLESRGRVNVVGNAAALGRVIRNLIDNAIRHAPEGSTVRVAVLDDGRPVVRVEDDGPGFPADFAPEAFENFTRADPSRTRDTGGAGLGLAVASGLIRAHGGRIWIDSPSGSCVAFELPPAPIG
jgi:signal transduction histidine kinase